MPTHRKLETREAGIPRKEYEAALERVAPIIRQHFEAVARRSTPVFVGTDMRAPEPHELAVSCYIQGMLDAATLGLVLPPVSA